MAHTLTEQSGCDRKTAFRGNIDANSAPRTKPGAESRFQPIEQLMSRFDELNLNFAVG